MKTTLLSLIASLMLITTLAQGSWMPPNADYSHPRGLLKASERGMVQTRILDSPFVDLFIDVYNDAQASYPDNSTDSNERRRARIARNAAFCAYLNRGVSSGNIVTLSPTDSAALMQKARTILETMDTDVANPFLYSDWQWDAKIIVDYLYAYDLLKGAGLPNDSLSNIRTLLQTQIGTLYGGVTYSQFGLSVIDLVRNNHLLMPLGALGSAAVILNDVGGSMPHQQPQSWLNLAMVVTDDLMFRNPTSRLSDPDSIVGYYEGPGYWRYAYLSMNKFFVPMSHFLPDTSMTLTYGSMTRNLRHPYYDPSYELVQQWIVNISMPDGRYPSLSDSFIYMGFPDAALMGKPHLIQEMYFDNLLPQQAPNLSKQLNQTADMRPDYICAYPDSSTAEAPLFFASPASGSLVFRSGNDPMSLYMHLSGGHGQERIMGTGHNQADETSFILYAYGKTMVMDPAYLSWYMRDSVGNAYNHSMILVDSVGPPNAFPTPSGAYDPGGADAYIEKPFDTPALDGGDIRTTYESTNFVRNSLFVRNRYFLVTDEVEGTGSHMYAHQIHGAGLEATGGFTPDYANHRASYSFGNDHLLCVVDGDGGAVSYYADSSIHEISYQNPDYHTALETRITGDNATFMAILFPYQNTDMPNVQKLSSPVAAAYRLEYEQYHDVMFSLEGTDTLTLSAAVSQLPTDLIARASMGFISVDSSSILQQLYARNLESISLGDTISISTSSPVSFLWQADNLQESISNYVGYVDQAATIRLKLPYRLGAVSGNGVMASYDAVAGEEVLVFSQATEFTAERLPANTFLPVEGLLLSGEMRDNKVELSWKTEQEAEATFFSVERSLDGILFEKIARVNAVGESQERQFYTSTDEFPLQGTSYYRVKLQFQDGSSSSSNIIQLKSEDAFFMELYPNPFHTQLLFHIRPYDESDIRLEIFDASGQMVFQEVWDSVNAIKQLDISHLAAGTYLYRVLHAGELKSGIIMKDE